MRYGYREIEQGRSIPRHNGINSPFLRLLKVGLGVDINSTGIFEAQLTRSSWLKKIDSAATGHLNISVSPKDDLAPGFYTVTGILAQVTN